MQSTNGRKYLLLTTIDDVELSDAPTDASTLVLCAHENLSPMMIQHTRHDVDKLHTM